MATNPSNEVSKTIERQLRRDEAAKYLTEEIGYPMTKGRLAKLACYGGGPAMRYAGKYPIYAPSELRRWAETNFTPPFGNTSQRQASAA
jgi:hypothetical protein